VSDHPRQVSFAARRDCDEEGDLTGGEIQPYSSGGPNVNEQPPHFRVAVVGAGFSGLCMSIRLLQEGIRDFVVLERADEVGGTWRDNTYPGCQCDIPSALYSFSFAPNPNWSRFYPLQEEIREYLRDCAARFGVLPYIRFGHEVTGAEWDEAAKRWRIESTRGTVTADVVVGGMGGLSAPSAPDIPGLEQFGGTVFHSANWDWDHDLTGERVGVIGTGASAVQFVPMIQPKVGQLALFQRTPAWVMPDPDRPVRPLERELWRRLPITQRLLRGVIYGFFEATVLTTIVNTRLARLMERVARRHLEEQVPDPELRAKLTPAYTLGCKRITLSDTYFPALTQPNAEVITEPIERITPDGVRTVDGVEHELDTIILGTGFKVHDNPAFSRVRGRDGRTLREAWEGSPRAYLGTTISGFPNLFLLVGPNSAGGFNSIIFTTEAHVNYAIAALKSMSKRGAHVAEVRREVYDRWTRQTDRRLAHSVWNEGGCQSWYLDANGRNGVWWPGFMASLWLRTRRFKPTEYELHPA
jgi:cation diffusion facilitator CzcD-associated flavoprotein CzcO